MSKTLNLRDGEANLDEKLFEDDSLGVVIQEALNRGLTWDSLRLDRVTKDGPWVSTDESTIPSAVLYMESGAKPDHLIVQRSKDEKYGLFRYTWTP